MSIIKKREVQWKKRRLEEVAARVNTNVTLNFFFSISVMKESMVERFELHLDV